MKKENRKYQIKTGQREDYPDHYHMPLELHYKGYKTMINAGQSDIITVFRNGQDMIVLTVNRSLGYAGLEYILVYADGLIMDGDVFIDNTEEFSQDAGLKKDLLDYSDNFIASFLYTIYIGD